MFKFGKSKSAGLFGDSSDIYQQAKKKQAELKEQKQDQENLYEKVLEKAVTELDSLIYEYYNHEKFQSCLTNIQKAIELKKDELTPYYYLAFILNLCGEKEEAKKYFEFIYSVNPEFYRLDELYQEIYEVEAINTEPEPEVEAEALRAILDELTFA